MEPMELPETEHELDELIERANRKKDELASGAVAEFNALVQKVTDAASELISALQA